MVNRRNGKRMRNKIVVVISMVLGLIGMSVSSTRVHADSRSSDMAYTVEANLPKSQVNQKVSYFDLQLNPGSKETVSLHIANTGKNTSTFDIVANQATTNKNGVIDYSDSTSKKDPSLKVDLNEIVSPVKKTITLEAGKEMDVPFGLTMPSNSFDGVVLGGFHVQKRVEDEKTSSKNVMIKNRYAFVVGLEIQNMPNQVTPDLKLPKAGAGLDNSYTSILVNLQNPTATIIHKMNVEGSITKQGKDTVLYKSSKKNMAVAPNSNFDFPVSMKKNAIQPGKYTAHIKASSEDNKYTWNLSKDFEIKADKAKKLNAKAVEVKKDTTWMIYVAAGVVVALLLIIILLLIRLGKNKQKQ